MVALVINDPGLANDPGLTNPPLGLARWLRCLGSPDGVEIENQGFWLNGGREAHALMDSISRDLTRSNLFRTVWNGDAGNRPDR